MASSAAATTTVTEPPSKPLLSTYIDDFHHHSPPPSESDPSSSSHYPTSITYNNHSNRPFKDLPFLLLFLLFLISTFSFGIFASINHNPNTPSSVSSFIYDIRTDSCIKDRITDDNNNNRMCIGLLPVLLIPLVVIVIMVMVWIIVVNWSRVELTVRIIRVSADALSNNLGLFGVLPVMSLGLVAYFVPIVVFLVYARLNGEIVPREKRGKVVCEWEQDGWVPAYYALAILTMLWSAAAMVEAQVYVISGTIAQWYFSKDDSRVKRSIRSSLRNAFGPSAGTICFSGLLIAVVRIVRGAVDTAANEDASGMINLVLRCCVNALLSAFEFLNKFTINFAAITGEAYCASARLTYELLRRNLLSAVVVEIVSTRLLAAIVFVLSAIYAIVVCVILKAATDLGVDSYFVAAVAFVLVLVILGFLVHVLDNVIDTVYICYAIDRDKGEVCKADVHDIYVNLPISRNHNPAYLNVRTPLLV
ncbi:hypothetical protein M8C21_017278 [Ambrosia artemisiifolia]|uniref:Choline transporter-like protein n=1 Tax=Ambrosia artemisiifolia TaxID=4212 RepID=A0AAD5G165_AMBAR|nr:hypothetical protein M8C21_017278 [Ambrosia artemisiifolia]